MKLSTKILMLLLLSIPLMATGPRITQNLISPDKKEVFALDIPPFISTEIEGGGLVNEIVNAVFKKADIKAVITTLPLQSMVKYYLKEENAFGIMGRHLGISAKDRETLAAVPIYMAKESYFYYKPLQKNPPKYEGKLSNLKALTYGASKGEDINAYKKAGIKVKRARTLSLFKKLQTSKIDFISVPIQSAEWFINKKFPKHKKEFTQMPTSSKTVDISIYFNLNHKDGKKSAERFKRGLLSIVKDGKYANILDKYLKDSNVVKAQLKHIRKVLK